MAEISCKRCKSPDCRGCNLYRLEQMLDSGKLNMLMNENRAIQSSKDVRPVVQGRWIGIDDFPYEDFECSSCGAQMLGDDKIPKEMHYCPNCGADMREVQDD